MKPFVLQVLILFSVCQVKAQSCDSFLESPALTPIVQGLQELSKNQKPVWSKFSVPSVPIFFINQRDFPNCIALWNEQKITTFSAPANIQSIQNGLYEFCGADPFKACPKSNETASSLDLGMLYRLDNVLEGLTAVGFMPAQTNLLTLSHEGFHIFGQYLGAKSQQWPVLQDAGFSLEARKEVIGKCYSKNLEVSEMTKAELQSLRSALHLVSVNEEKTEIKEQLFKFFETRKKRHEIVKEERILDITGKSQSCEEAESKMELMEGSAEFVGLQTAIDAKVMSYEDIDRWLGLAIEQPNGPSEPYYRFGAMALMIVRKLSPDQLEQMISRINKQTNSQNTIIFELEQWTLNL